MATPRFNIDQVNGLQAALDARQPISGKGIALGYAPLDADGLIDPQYLPSYVDDVIEVADYPSLPGVGERGKLYVTLDDNKTYRWTGTVWVEVSAATPSDARLKENIRAYEPAPVHIEWVRYNYKNDSQEHIGVIANQVQSVLPETIRVDGKGYRSVILNEVLIAKVAELEARIQRLEGYIELLSK